MWQFIALTALLAANAVQANDSWPQRLIGGLVVGSAVTGVAIAQGTVQRYMTLYGIGPENLTRMARYQCRYCEEIRKEIFRLTPESYRMTSYKQAVLLYSAGIGLIATVTACLGLSPLDVSEVMKPVAVGMGVIGASYLAGALCGYNEFKTQADLDKYEHNGFNRQSFFKAERVSKEYRDDEPNYRRYLAAKAAYNTASTITPFVVVGVGGWMIYDRYTRS